ncbi:MAG: PD-(D/E)XK nuclease family protein [Rubrobacter sp.]
MNESQSDRSDRKALEEFVVGNAELEKLEAMLDRFNIFEAVGMERQEIQHSKFLAFLLDSNQPHGMGDAFLKRFLQRAVAGSPSTVVTPIELSLWDLGGTSVRREWNHIDIFLLDEENRLAVIVENKIGTGEHSGQLERYYDLVREQHPDYRILAVYLTPDGSEPSHSEYLPLGYGEVCEALDEVSRSKASVMEPDAAVLITHYTDMLRRNIVGDSEIARLAQQIYQKHQRAIDLIVENRFSHYEVIGKLLSGLIRENENLAFGYRETYATGDYIVFEPQDWKTPTPNVGQRHRNSRLILYFVFWNDCEYNLSLWLELGLGNSETRRKLFSMARNQSTIFRESSENLDDDTILFSRTFLSSDQYKNSSGTEREAEIRKNWNDFLENDLPLIDAALRAEEWI